MNEYEYHLALRKEADHWSTFEKEILKDGIPWWSDLQRANLKKKNLFWRHSPKKEDIIRGRDKQELIQIASERGGKILDLGCGSGWLSLELARRGARVVAIDISPERLQAARRFVQQNPYQDNFGSLEYRREDLNKMNLDNESFEVVVAWDSLHHVLELERLVLQVKKALKPGGIFIFYDHIGNQILKFLSNIQLFFMGKKRKDYVSPFEDVSQEEMIKLVYKYFDVQFMRFRNSFIASSLYYTLFKFDFFIRFLPWVVRIDHFLCNKKILRGEYVFICAIKE